MKRFTGDTFGSPECIAMVSAEPVVLDLHERLSAIIRAVELGILATEDAKKMTKMLVTTEIRFTVETTGEEE